MKLFGVNNSFLSKLDRLIVVEKNVSQLRNGLAYIKIELIYSQHFFIV
jgi:hypothetical protein